MDKDINIKNLRLPYIEKTVNLCIKRELNHLKGNNGTGKTLLLVQRIINNCYIKPMPLPLH